ncbi:MULTISPECIES: two-partner secretion domain-containing protein [unclassified Nostoc]|uniref:two-partner secretion domain-containing protein n=1 Tax=unclassified Nostoc TaxID=2593658 RepID=UPI002635A849|nr:filamentous hemagglutinin N-terminal domain-containing protein [Nostoc sp. S13]MDF5738477.1 filamentous hemagglutinin N-terminal domain-containing protein [Nostoc sp. S13]
MSGITQDWRCWCSRLVVGSLLIASLQDRVFAQITPDATLANNSSVTREGNIFNITGGTQAGSNLFHSFSEFSVPNNGAALFNNAVDIQNIISRVTGGSVSKIDGLIGAKGTANLFLINPNGIIFGQNAQLNIGGSFVGTTASAIAFGNQGFFSASNPESSSSLLTVNPSALLFHQIKTASIENNSIADSGLNPSSEYIATGLRVPDGKSLLLVGGDINMDGGGLFAFGGRVELGGLAGAGTVGLNGDGSNLSASFPDNVERSDVFLSNGAGVAVTADDGGTITINARNLEMTGESGLYAGIATGLGSNNSKAGNIEVNATGVINLDNGSDINNVVIKGASGQGGSVLISARTLQVKGGAQISAATFGNGKGGNLTVDAQDVQLIGSITNPELPSGLFTSSGSESIGDAGNLTIKTITLLIKDGAQVNAGTRGVGKGGNLTVDAQDVQLIGTSVGSQFPSALFANAEQNSTGDAGDLTIKTNTLLVKDGAVVGTATFNGSKGGNLTIDAQDVQLIGTSIDGRTRGLATSAQPNSTGDAGDLNIKTNTLLVKDGAAVGTATFGAGKGGNLTINAQDVQIIGESADGQFSSGLSTDAQPYSTGDAGDLNIKTNTLLVGDGAQVSSGTFGAGKGGNLMVDAQYVQLFGKSADGQFSSGLFAAAGPDSTGDAGNLTVKTNTLLAKDGAGITVRSAGIGTAGNMTLNTRSIRLNNNAFLTGSTQSAKVDLNRAQATININSQDLIISHNSNIFTNGTGENVIGGNKFSLLSSLKSLAVQYSAQKN